MPAKPTSTIRFYFDYVSPNAYLAWTQLPALAARHGAAIEPAPVLFAGLLEAHGQLGPAEVPPKIRWMTRNIVRKAALLRVPLNPPVFHPFNPILALRVSLLAPDVATRCALIDGLFQAVWDRALHVAEPAVVEAVADQVGLSGKALVARAQRPESKASLRAATDDAIASGVFGVPTMQVGDELFWGYDDFPHLERYLAGEEPVDAFTWQRWLGPSRASAVRKIPRPDRT